MRESKDERAFRCEASAVLGVREGAGLALTVGRMLVAARLLPESAQGRMGFLDPERELTGPDWQAMVQALSKRWEATRRGARNPFDEPRERLPETPGALEGLRRVVLRHLTPNEIPDWLPQAVLDLADPRDFFAAKLDPGVRDLMIELALPEGARRVYCGYEFSAGVALAIAHKKGVEVRLDLSDASLAALVCCLALAEDLRLEVKVGEPIRIAEAELLTPSLLREEYDAAIVMPPFGVRLLEKLEHGLGTGLPAAASIETAAVTLALARGREAAACVLPKSFLFRATRIDQAFKESVIRDFGLSAVVGLPSGTFGGTGLAPALLLFDRTLKPKRKGGIVVVDAGGERDRRTATLPPGIADAVRKRRASAIAAIVGLEEIAKNDFNLSVERYVLDSEAKRAREFTTKLPSVSLDELVELIRAQAIPSPKPGTRKLDLDIREVGVADIDEAGIVRAPAKEVIASAESLQQIRKVSLEAGDILLVIKGSIGKVGYVREVPKDGRTWVASQSFVILRLRKHAPFTEPLVLFRFLSSSLGQQMLQSLRSGMTVPGLQMGDVRRLPVILPSAQELKAVEREITALFDLQDKIRELKAELAARQARIWPDNQRETAEA